MYEEAHREAFFYGMLMFNNGSEKPIKITRADNKRETVYDLFVFHDICAGYNAGKNIMQKLIREDLV